MKKPNVINIVAKPENEDVFLFKQSLSKLTCTLDTVDRAGIAIGKRNLSTDVLMSFVSLIIWYTKKEVQNSIPAMPSYEEYQAQVEKYNAAHVSKESGAAL